MKWTLLCVVSVAVALSATASARPSKESNGDDSLTSNNRQVSYILQKFDDLLAKKLKARKEVVRTGLNDSSKKSASSSSNLKEFVIPEPKDLNEHLAPARQDDILGKDRPKHLNERKNKEKRTWVQIKENIKAPVTGLCAGNSPVTGEFLTQRASNAEIFPFDDVVMSYAPGQVTDARKLQVTAGAIKKDYFVQEDSRQLQNVAEVIVHEGYYTDVQDLALLKLAEDLVWNDYVRPVCLPTSDVAGGTMCWITGWGDTAGTSDNSVLQEAQVPIMSQSTCKTTDYVSDVNQYMLCAGYQQGGVDTCEGDSGGPLVCNSNGAYVLYGVTSWGLDCAKPNKPGVYARVASMMDWVDKKTGGNYYTR